MLWNLYVTQTVSQDYRLCWRLSKNKIHSLLRKIKKHSPLPSSKNPHFQNEAKCTILFVKISFICVRGKITLFWYRGQGNSKKKIITGQRYFKNGCLRHVTRTQHMATSLSCSPQKHFVRNTVLHLQVTIRSVTYVQFWRVRKDAFVLNDNYCCLQLPYVANFNARALSSWSSLHCGCVWINSGLIIQLIIRQFDQIDLVSSASKMAFPFVKM